MSTLGNYFFLDTERKLVDYAGSPTDASTHEQCLAVRLTLDDLG